MWEPVPLLFCASKPSLASPPKCQRDTNKQHNTTHHHRHPTTPATHFQQQKLALDAYRVECANDPFPPPAPPSPSPPPSPSLPPPSPGPWWKPAAADLQRFQYQLSVVFDPARHFVDGVTVYGIDGFDTPAAAVDAIKARGAVPVSAFLSGRHVLAPRQRRTLLPATASFRCSKPLAASHLLESRTPIYERTHSHNNHTQTTTRIPDLLHLGRHVGELAPRRGPLQVDRQGQGRRRLGEGEVPQHQVGQRARHHGQAHADVQGQGLPGGRPRQRCVLLSGLRLWPRRLR